MAWRRACIFALILCAVVPSLGQSSQDGVMSAAEYGSRLDKLIASTSQPTLTGKEIADILSGLSPSWRVNINDNQFEMSTQWLREDLLKYGDKADADLLKSARAKLSALRADLNGYLDTSPDNSAARVRLGNILSRPEFGDARGPGLMERLKQRLFLFIVRLLSRVFGLSSIPTIGKFLVYGLVALALLGLAYWIYRTLSSDAQLEHIVPPTMAVSAKEWTLWMAEAREAANQGNWREAIHLAYWAGISFLESQGTWRPDRARTPREYLRLMPQSSERHSTLTALTRNFEVVWYGNREADSQAFSQTLQELEKLGCRQS
jgi:hypothetical protein